VSEAIAALVGGVIGALLALGGSLWRDWHITAVSLSIRTIRWYSRLVRDAPALDGYRDIALKAGGNANERRFTIELRRFGRLATESPLHEFPFRFADPKIRDLSREASKRVLGALVEVRHRINRGEKLNVERYLKENVTPVFLELRQRLEEKLSLPRRVTRLRRHLFHVDILDGPFREP
jgi:hypothetical protein